MVKGLSTNSSRADQLNYELVKSILYNINSCFQLGIDEEIVRRLLTIYMSREGRKFLDYLVSHMALTTKTVQAEEHISKQTLSLILNGLKDLGVVFRCTELRDPRLKRRGPKFDVWLLAGADPQYAREAQKRHLELIREERKQIENYGQVILDEAIAFLKTSLGSRREASLKEFLPQLRAQGIPIELARAAAHELNNSGDLRIWL